MVALRTILTALLLLSSTALWGQNFPADDTVTEHRHKGTYYHDKFEGRKTANGEIFDQNLFTAAHWKIKLGTYVMVTNQNTGLQVIVRVNDRCPKHGVLDMSHRAANSIGIKGCQPVTVRILPPTDEYIERWKAQDGLFDSVYSKFGGPKPQAKKSTAAPRKKTPPATGNAAQITVPQISDKPGTPVSAPRFNLSLCTAGSHSEAFMLMQKLPQHYQEKTIIDSSDHSHLHVILDVRLTQKSAQELGRALKHSFPDCKTIPAE